MPAVHLLGANKINADTAGQTKSRLDAAPAVAVHQTATEMVHGAESLSTLLGGGTHPETDFADVFHNTDVEQATDSVKSALGGLVPKRGSTVAAGPAGRAASIFNRVKTKGV